MKHKLWPLDCICFHIQGKNSQSFLNMAASQKIRLTHIQWEQNGFSARGLGRDYRRLEDIAIRGGWTFSLLRRLGPGSTGEALLMRPGIILGFILFIALLGVMNQLVWTIHFGDISEEAQNRLRVLLDACGIREGASLTEDSLQKAQELVLQQSDLFGWISLNFSGGCLFIESTPTQDQSVQSEPEEKPLYAKIDGEILAIEAESGFSVVLPGQSVTQGDLLVDNKRLDRDGNEVRQGVRGKILARCQKSYTVSQPCEIQTTLLTGYRTYSNRLSFFGILQSDEEGNLTNPGMETTEWIPLELGRLRLPGCIRRVTCWELSEQTVVYSQQQASALAQRTCRRRLLAEFPDAMIEAEKKEIKTSEQEVICTITYQFQANIASQEPSQEIKSDN